MESTLNWFCSLGYAVLGEGEEEDMGVIKDVSDQNDLGIFQGNFLDESFAVVRRSLEVLEPFVAADVIADDGSASFYAGANRWSMLHPWLWRGPDPSVGLPVFIVRMWRCLLGGVVPRRSFPAPPRLGEPPLFIHQLSTPADLTAFFERMVVEYLAAWLDERRAAFEPQMPKGFFFQDRRITHRAIRPDQNDEEWIAIFLQPSLDSRD